MPENISKHTLGLTQLQSGQGIPNHNADKGSLYIDVLTTDYYKNTDGLNTWVLLVSGDYLPLSGGTVTGETVFTSGITANTISEVDYIDFKTTPSVPSPTGGTLYFDSTENALSYKPVTNQNDVTVNIGQENLIRIYNDLGYQINNGQVLHITGATLGIPTVALANASKLGTGFTESLAQSSGVATHDIPSEEFGFMTNFGIVRDLNTSGFTPGQELFLSDTIDGGITNDPNSIAFTSRISTLGWCLSTSSTSGKIYVKIENENPLQSLTQQELNVLVGNTISTGAYFYTGATTASTTTINVSPMRGWIVYNTGSQYATNPLVLNIYYSGGTNLGLTGLTSSFDTYLLVNSGGTLYQTNSFPSPEERRLNIFLGRVVHPNKTTILNVEQTVDYDVSPLSSLRDLWVPIKIINEGVVPSSNGVSLTFKTSSGTFWGNGIGFPTNELNPNSITVPGYIPASFYYTTQTGGTFTAKTTTVDTTKYDVGGVAVNVPGNGNYTTQRIYMSQSGVIRLQYGQEYYSTLAKAIAAIPSETFVVNPDNSIDCTLIGLLTVKDGTSNLSNVDDAVFTFVSKFGENLGGTAGISTTTLQQAYNNSTNPEITTNLTLGGIQFKGGTGTNTDNNIIIENNSGTVTGFWRADGSLSATSITGTSANINGNLTVTGNTTIGLGLTANTVSASTYYNLPYVTGGTATYTGVSGSILLTYNTGQTFTVTGLTDEKTTGGTYSNGVYIFTTNSGNTYQVSSTTTYSAGIISGSTGWLNNSGEINLPAVKVALFNNSNNIEPIFVYDIPSGTTGFGGIPSLTNNSTNYVVIEYNGGSPRYNVYINDTSNDSDVVLSYIVYRLNTVIHVLEFGNYGAGLANKLNDRLVMTDRFGWESGVSLGLSGSTGIVTLSSGVVWNGSYRQSLDGVNSQDDFFFKNYHVSSAWTYNITGDTINNTYYDNLINIVSGTTGKYLVNYYYRGQETNDHLYEVYSQAEYDSVNEAEGAPNPTLPELITSHAFLVGRIIVQVGQTTGLTQTAFSTVFLPSGYASSSGFHNDLLGIDGGTAGQYYHLNQLQYNNVAYQNSGNTFTQNQIINASLSANTITINNTPNFNNQNTQILTRNSTNGNIEYSDSSSANIFNYGLANAMVNLNFLT